MTSVAVSKTRAQGARHARPLPSRTRRVRVEKEHSPLALMGAMPAGYRPPRHVMEWKRAADAWLDSRYMRADARRNRARVVRWLAETNNPRTRTILTTWQRIQDTVGIARRTVARILAELRQDGLLVVVATGRSAARTPQATGRTSNEAPVYALCVECSQDEAAPTDGGPQEGDAGANGHVDISGTPDPVGRVKKHLRAREANEPESSRYAAGLTRWQRASRAAFGNLYEQRKDHSWSRHATMKPETRLGRRSAQRQELFELALCVQVHVLRAREATTAAVAAEIRPFMLAGWTVGDVIHALDRAPDGTSHWYSDSGFFRPETWLRHRLSQWRTAEGEVRAAFTHRAEAARAQDQARARAEAERTAARRAKATPAPAWFRAMRETQNYR